MSQPSLGRPRGRAHLDPGGLFLQPKGDAAIPIAPAPAVDGLDHDLLREIGDGHRHVAFAAQQAQDKIEAAAAERKLQGLEADRDDDEDLDAPQLVR
jgi:hypothetical protein